MKIFNFHPSFKSDEWICDIFRFLVCWYYFVLHQHYSPFHFKRCLLSVEGILFPVDVTFALDHDDYFFQKTDKHLRFFLKFQVYMTNNCMFNLQHKWRRKWLQQKKDLLMIRPLELVRMKKTQYQEWHGSLILILVGSYCATLTNSMLSQILCT